MVAACYRSTLTSPFFDGFAVQVDPEELGGKRAELLLPTLRQHVASVRKLESFVFLKFKFSWPIKACDIVAGVDGQSGAGRQC
jgi:hypothetical protein